MARGRVRRGLTVVVVCLLLAGGAVAMRRLVDRQIALGRIQRNEQTWMRQRPADYRYDIEIVCFCAGPRTFSVVVADGRVDSVEPDAKPPFRPPTIEELFDVARHAINHGADSVEDSYAADGHLTRLSIDQMKISVDDEVLYLVHDLTPRPRVAP